MGCMLFFFTFVPTSISMREITPPRNKRAIRASGMGHFIFHNFLSVAQLNAKVRKKISNGVVVQLIARTRVLIYSHVIQLIKKRVA